MCSEEEYEKQLLQDDSKNEKETEEEALEKAWKDHQMMRNSRKMKRAKGTRFSTNCHLQLFVRDLQLVCKRSLIVSWNAKSIQR